MQHYFGYEQDYYRQDDYRQDDYWQDDHGHCQKIYERIKPVKGN
jgi:hypothetical protein